jgi:hypothetical protein
MLRHSHHRRLVTAAITAAVLAAAAPTAPARPIDSVGPSANPTPEPEPVRVVRVQVDEGLDWGDTGIGAAGMLALVLAGFGAAQTLRSVPSR